MAKIKGAGREDFYHPNVIQSPGSGGALIWNNQISNYNSKINSNSIVDLFDGVIDGKTHLFSIFEKKKKTKFFRLRIIKQE